MKFHTLGGVPLREVHTNHPTAYGTRSSASVMQISGGSTPLAKEGAQIFFFFFWLALPSFLPSAIFLTQRALRTPPLDPQLQMDKYKEITGFNVK